MSLINDALNKAERDRAEAAVVDAARLDPLARERKRREQQKRRSLGSILGNVAVLGLIFAMLIGTFVWQRTPSAPAPISTAPRDFIEQTDPIAQRTPAALPAQSPFNPPDPEEASPSAPPPEYALAGMSVLGEDTLLSVVRQSDRRSVWVPVGKSVGEVTAVSYDPQRDEAVIRVAGRDLTIRMGAFSSAAE